MNGQKGGKMGGRGAGSGMSYEKYFAKVSQLKKELIAAERNEAKQLKNAARKGGAARQYDRKKENPEGYRKVLRDAETAMKKYEEATAKRERLGKQLNKLVNSYQKSQKKQTLF